MAQAVYNINITYRHIEGARNIVADRLSRAHFSQHARALAQNEIDYYGLTSVQPCMMWVSYSQDLFFPDPEVQRLLHKAAARQETAWAPGTIKNYQSAISRYIAFCFHVQMQPTLPCFPLICAYIEELASESLSPRTIQNHISHVRTYLRKSLADTQQIDHVRVKWAIDAIKRDTSFVPRIKKAMPTPTLQYLVETLPSSVTGNTVKVAILVIFYAALRQSEVAAPSANGFDPTRHLTRHDVKLCDDRGGHGETCKKYANYIRKEDHQSSGIRQYPYLCGPSSTTYAA